MAAKEIEVSTQPNIKVNLENDEATHYTCTEEKKQQNGHWSTAATPRPFLVEVSKEREQQHPAQGYVKALKNQ